MIDLTKENTHTLLKWMLYTRQFSGKFNPHNGDVYVTYDELKAELAKREHVPSHAESKRKRIEKIKRGI